jgi:hypothetical protein
MLKRLAAQPGLSTDDDVQAALIKECRKRAVL